jgi:hypothetical protein
MEELVQSWLDKNKNWFQLYALENLDLTTVDKWLRSNGKHICKCVKMDNNFPPWSSSTTKRNSISIPIIDRGGVKSTTTTTISNNVLLRQCDGVVSDQMNGVRAFTNNPNNNTDMTSKSEAPKKATASCHLNSSSCIIHNRKSTHLVHSDIHSHQLTSKYSFVEELKSDSDSGGEESDSSPSSTLQPPFSAPSSTLMNIAAANNISSGRSKKGGAGQSNGGGGLSTSSSGTQMRKFHSFHSSSDSSNNNSLNALKVLIKSKIKLPHTFNLNGSVVAADKMRQLKYNDDKSRQGVLLELIKDISNEMDLKRLTEKIITNVRLLLNADKASLFFACQNKGKLAAFKFDPHTGNKSSTIYSARNASAVNDFELEIPFDNSILATVAQTGRTINIPNVQKVRSLKLN